MNRCKNVQSRKCRLCQAGSSPLRGCGKLLIACTVVADLLKMRLPQCIAQAPQQQRGR